MEIQEAKEIIGQIKQELAGKDVSHIEIHDPILWSMLGMACDDYVDMGPEKNLFGLPLVMGPVQADPYTLCEPDDVDPK